MPVSKCKVLWSSWSARRPVKAEVAGSSPVRTATSRVRAHHGAAGPGSSVGTSVRLKIGRSAVRPRPWPPSLSPGFEHRPPAETPVGVLLSELDHGAAQASRPSGLPTDCSRRLFKRVGGASEACGLLDLSGRLRTHQVCVDPTRNLRRGVPGDQLHDLDRDASGEHERACAVSQVMQQTLEPALASAMASGLVSAAVGLVRFEPLPVAQRACGDQQTVVVHVVRRVQSVHR